MKLYNLLIIHLYFSYLIFDKFSDFDMEFSTYSVKILNYINLNK